MDDLGSNIVDKIHRSVGFKAKIKIGLLMFCTVLINLGFLAAVLAIGFGLFKYFFLIK